MKLITPSIWQIIKTVKFSLLYYSLFGKKKGNEIIYFADGKCASGGLADRFKGIISLYHYCKINNREFRINFTKPCNLNDILHENKCRWYIEKKDISNNLFYSKPVYLMNEFCFERFLSKLKSNKQLHIYCNVDFLPLFDKSLSWKDEFDELFKMNDDLERDVNQYKNNYKDWVSCHFRFQGYIGDEYLDGVQQLESSKIEEILNRCINYLLNMQKTYKGKVFVFTDSRVFIERVKNINENIIVISNEPEHIDNKSNVVKKSSFYYILLDFFVLSMSSKIYSVGTDIMYPSQFPQFASKYGECEFERVII